MHKLHAGLPLSIAMKPKWRGTVIAGGATALAFVLFYWPNRSDHFLVTLLLWLLAVAAIVGGVMAFFETVRKNPDE